ncbi:Alpha/Beta hydrolase protein [Plectosphaerella plurivora]|uniref:Alpha/Beta hydrolase protein n=1 Tax=Plectosphaerella plurivora TaxID=936078 RepID=A0A9P8VLH7_9PEZI|nr:Alpha/Beta hydrolase protein [Plectosphaerella plurivora]
MPHYKSPVDGTTLFYRSYGPESRPHPFEGKKPSIAAQKVTLVFLHQWPLSSRMYDSIILSLCETHRFRIVAPDRRGFGKSEWNKTYSEGGTGYKELGQDVTGLLEHLQIGPFVFVAASMGTGEALSAYSSSTYVQENCRGMIWISTCLPYPVASPENPKALPRAAWDGTLKTVREDRFNFLANGFKGPFGIGTRGTYSEKELSFYEKIFFEADPVAVERCLQIFSTENLTEEVKKFGQTFDKPFLLIHGEHDGGVAVDAGSGLVQKLVPQAELKVYEGGGHVLVLGYTDRLRDDILAFIGRLGL